MKQGARSLNLFVTVAIAAFLASCSTVHRPIPKAGTLSSPSASDAEAAQAGPRTMSALPGSQKNGGAGERNGLPAPDAKKTLILTEYVREGEHDWRNEGPRAIVSDLYTKVIVEADDTQRGDCVEATQDCHRRNYWRERRGFLARIFLGTYKKSSAANVKFIASDPKLDFNVPLYLLEHESARDKGELFKTVYTASNVETPFFRIASGTTVSFKIEASHSEAVEVGSLVAGLGKAITVVSNLVTGIKLFSEASRKTFDTAAKEIDVELAALLKTGITETINIGRFVDQWRPGNSLTIEVYAPWRDYAKDRKRVTANIGTWRVSLVCPRPSVFSERDICPQGNGLNDVLYGSRTEVADLQSDIAKDVSLSEIMAFRLIDGVHLKDRILASQYMQVFQGTSPMSPESLCGMMAQDLYREGFNAFDAGLTILASTRTIPAMIAKRTQIEKACKDLGILDGINWREAGS